MNLHLFPLLQRGSGGFCRGDPGWSPKDDREIMDWTEMVRDFELTGVARAAAAFSPEKLQWMNGRYIRSLSDEELADRIAPQLVKAGLMAESEPESRREWLCRLAHATKERLRLLTDIVPYSDYLFREIDGYDEKGVKKRWSKPGVKQIMADLAGILEESDPFDEQTIETHCREYIEREGVKLAELVHPARIALTGKTVGPGFFETVELVGKEKSLERLGRCHPLHKKPRIGSTRALNRPKFARIQPYPSFFRASICFIVFAT